MEIFKYTKIGTILIAAAKANAFNAELPNLIVQQKSVNRLMLSTPRIIYG